MKYNTDPSFIGLDRLKQEHASQIAQFETWAARDQWETFHYSHYDWWVFPINRRSRLGMKYVVFEGDIQMLQADSQFMQRYRTGVRLVSASWGWNVEQVCFIPNPKHGQSWHDWPVRLYKAAQSTQVFSELNLFESLKTYALHLMKDGCSMQYGNKDLSWLFTTGVDPYRSGR